MSRGEERPEGAGGGVLRRGRRAAARFEVYRGDGCEWELGWDPAMETSPRSGRHQVAQVAAADSLGLRTGGTHMSMQTLTDSDIVTEWDASTPTGRNGRFAQRWLPAERSAEHGAYETVGDPDDWQDYDH